MTIFVTQAFNRKKKFLGTTGTVIKDDRSNQPFRVQMGKVVVPEWWFPDNIVVV